MNSKTHKGNKMKNLIIVCLLCLSLQNAQANEATAQAIGGTAAITTATAIGVTSSFYGGAAIVSGLAWLGGGTMAIGLGVVAIVPIAVGGAAYGTYKLIKDDE